MATRRALCAEEARERGESLTATASRIDFWLLVEYRGLWSRDLIPGSGLSERVKAHLREQLAAQPRSRLLFISRPQRRSHPRLAVFAGRTIERDSRFHGLQLASHEELVGLDLAGPLPGSPLDHPLFVVCTHGKRDRCCAKFGRPLYEEVQAHVDPAWVWRSSHVGGDRFAGNLVCFPEGLYFGRVEPDEAGRILDEYRAGRIWLERYRGRSCYPFHVQAGEHAIRVATGLVGIVDLEFARVERKGEAWLVAFSAVASGELYEVEVCAEEGAPAYLTCGAVRPRAPRHYAAR